MQKIPVPAILALAFGVIGLSVPVSAQVTVTTTDIQRLQDRVYDAGSEIAQVRARDADVAARMQADLDQLREEVVYLKVKLRKEGSVTRAEYADLRDRIDRLAMRAREEGRAPRTGSTYSAGVGAGTSSSGSVTTGTGATGSTTASGAYGSSTASPATRSAAARSVPVGTEMDVRLQTSLNSGTAQVEQRFDATTAVDLKGENGQVLIPAGSLVRGIVSDVKSAGRVERKASLTLTFDQITVRGRNYPIRATVAPFEGEGVRGDASKIGTGAGVGAIIGGILGGFKGALAGILIGGGGVVAATEGQEVNLPAGTVLRLRFDTPLELR